MVKSLVVRDGQVSLKFSTHAYERKRHRTSGRAVGERRHGSYDRPGVFSEAIAGR